MLGVAVLALLLLVGLYLIGDWAYHAIHRKTTNRPQPTSTNTSSQTQNIRLAEYWLIITGKEALSGTKKTLTRNGKRLEIIIPAGTRSQQKIKLKGALEVTDQCKGDIVVIAVLEKDVQDLGYNHYPRVKLINNPTASKPTVEQLNSFCCGYDNGKMYIPRIYVCANFAERFHNVAESNGIRTAYVVVEFDSGELHALNLVETVEEKYFYIDSTGGIACFVDVIPRQQYVPKPVDTATQKRFLPMGTVKAIRQIIW